MSTHNKEEEVRQKALQINYELKKYGISYCSNCNCPIEEYENVKSGLCQECKEELDNY